MSNTRQIAIIHTECGSGYSDYTPVIKSITNWSEVTEEEFWMLNEYQRHKAYITMLEQIDAG